MDSKRFEELMIAYLSGEITEDESKQLWEYLNNNSAFQQKYDEMAKLRALSFIPFFEKSKKEDYKQVQPKRKAVLWLKLNWAGRVAAVLLISLIASYFIFFNDSISDLKMCYETVVPLGSQSKVFLPDGTVVWLNSGSKLRYDNDFGHKKRVVELTGEGYFEVKRNSKVPFSVLTGNLQVKVLGTVFNVRCYSDEQKIEVNLLNGKVDVLANDSGTSMRLTLEPDQKATYNKETKDLLLSMSDAKKSSAWTTGKLYFTDASFSEIVKELERRYDVKIEVLPSRLKNEIFTGSLDLNQSIEDVISYIDADDNYIVIKKGKNISIINK